MVNEKNGTKVIEVLGEILTSGSEATKSWLACEGGKSIAADVMAGKLSAKSVEAAKKMEALLRVCRSRRGSEAQNALITMLGNSNASAASDPSAFGISK